MGTEVLDLSGFKGQAPSKLFATQPDMDDNLSDGIGSSYGIIGYRGKVWSLRYRGENHVFTRADDGSPMSYIDVVILLSPPHKSKTYYPSFDQDGSAGQRPLCASQNDVTPDVGVLQKQAETCALCPRNTWKTDANGRRRKECQDHKRLAVLLMPAQTQKLLGAPLLEPVFLRVPAASLPALSTMGDTMKGQGYHYSSFITRISFVPEAAHPQMVFKPVRGLTDQEAQNVIPMRKDPIALRIVGEGEQTATTATALPPPQALSPTPTTGVVVPFTQVDPSPKVLTLEPELSMFGAPSAPAVASAPPAVASAPVATLVAANPAPAVAQVADESDAALDARLAELMKSVGN